MLTMKKQLKSFYLFLKNRPRFDWIFAGVALTLYVFLALWNISLGSIWFDEAFSAYIIQFNVIDIARYTAGDVHPPFFYWLLKGWTGLFGHTELGLRSMSVFFGVVTALIGYLWVQRQFGRRAALIGLGVLALSPLFIRYSQEARMYTLSTAIVMAATYVMTVALETNRRRTWLLYGALVSLGMWTHYFTALAWIAHWIWRVVMVSRTGVRGKALWRAFFTKNWVIAYAVAVGLFLPWIPAMAYQLFTIQSQGFWIKPVGVETIGTYFGTLVLFLESYQITGWAATGLIGIGLVLSLAAIRTFKKADTSARRYFGLLLSLAAVPPVVLFIVSMPPLTSSFIERYLLPSAVASAFLVGVVLAFGLRGQRLWKQGIVYSVLIALLVSGLFTMYYYGNYNKSSLTGVETGALIKQIATQSEPGIPIIAGSPWVFYEAHFYDSAEHPIYFINADTDYYFGSLDMLEHNDQHKIKDLNAFLKEHPTVWYATYSEGPLEAPRDGWKKLEEVSITNHVDGKTVYKAAKFLTTSAE
jgi:mannosyltransferase